MVDAQHAISGRREVIQDRLAKPFAQIRGIRKRDGKMNPIRLQFKRNYGWLSGK